MSTIAIQPLKPVRPLTCVQSSPHWTLREPTSQPLHRIVQQNESAWSVEMLTWPAMKVGHQSSGEAFRFRVTYFASYWQVMDFVWDLDDKSGIHFAYGKLKDHEGVVHSVSFFMEVK